MAAALISHVAQTGEADASSPNPVVRWTGYLDDVPCISNPYNPGSGDSTMVTYISTRPQYGPPECQMTHLKGDFFE